MNIRELSTRWPWQPIAVASSAVIAFSAVRGVAAGYQPVGDNALIELRGRDVLTSDHPLLGTWSSASISAGIDVNHPGPLIFDLVALPVRLLGAPLGIAVAVALLHIVTVWVVGWVAERTGGATAAIAAMAVTTGIIWMLGSELLYDPWQPNLLVLPFWLFLVTLWAIVAGDVALFPLACVAGSFLMQTHLGYIILVPVLLGFGAFVAVRARRDGSRAELIRPALLSAGVIVLLWAQPLWEQFFGAGRGNLGRVVTAGTGGGDGEKVESVRTGVGLGVRILGSVLALPPWWGRPGYDDSIPSSTWVDGAAGRELSAPGLRSTAPSVLGLLALAAIVGLTWHIARRAGATHVVAGFRVVTATLVVTVATVVITPIDVLGLSPHKLRWLWVVGAFITFVVTLALLSGLPRVRRHQALAGLGIIAAAALVATVPTHANRSGPVYFLETYESIEDLRTKLGTYLDDHEIGPVLFDADGIGFAEPYTAPVMAELIEHGVDLVVADASLARQLGPDRLADPADPTDGGTRHTVSVRVGQDAIDLPSGAVLLAFHDGERTPFTIDDVTDRAVAVVLVEAETT